MPAATPFRAAFDCLWCGRSWTTRGPDDLEGWSQLCPECLGKAGTNRFLRDRMRAGLERRGAAARGGAGERAVPAAAAGPADVGTADGDRAGLGERAVPPRDASDAGAIPERAAAIPIGPVVAPLGRAAAPTPRAVPVTPAFPDDWFFRRGAFSRGAIHDTAWLAELDALTRWVDGQPLRGVIVEPAAGVGYFSPLLAGRGELWASELDEPAAELARDRLLAHRLTGHLHVHEPWTAPRGEPAGDVLLAAFVLGRVRAAGVETVLRGWRDRLRRGGRLLVAELLPDPDGGPPPGTTWTHHDPDDLVRALRRAGFAAPAMTATGRFFRQLAADAD